MFAIRFITLYKNPSQNYNTPIKNLLVEWVNTDLCTLHTLCTISGAPRIWVCKISKV